MPLNSNWPLTVERTFGDNCLVLKAERTNPTCNKKFKSQLNQYKLSLQDGKLDISFNDQITEELHTLLKELMHQIMQSYPGKVAQNLYAQANIRLTGNHHHHHHHHHHLMSIYTKLY